MTPVFRATAEEGRLRFADEKVFKDYLKTLKGEVEVTVKKRTKKRSDNQNRYYWGVIIAMLSGYTGYETEEMHEALKWKFLKKPGATAELPDTVRSTSDLTTAEFEDYMERVRRWASTELLFSIPLPHEAEA